MTGVIGTSSKWSTVTYTFIYIICDGKRQDIHHITVWIIEGISNNCKVGWQCETKNYNRYYEKGI